MPLAKIRVLKKLAMADVEIFAFAPENGVQFAVQMVKPIRPNAIWSVREAEIDRA